MIASVIDDPRYRPGWFHVGEYALYAPPKTGFTSLKLNLGESCLHGSRVPSDLKLIIGLRDPLERFVSQYNMLVLSGWVLNHPNPIKTTFDPDWVEEWFDPELALKDPVGSARRWLQSAFPVLESWGGDHHAISQHRSIRSLLGRARIGTVEYINHRTWEDWFRLHLDREYVHHNRSYYVVPKHYFSSLKDIIQLTHLQDYQLIQQTGINNI